MCGELADNLVRVLADDIATASAEIEDVVLVVLAEEILVYLTVAVAGFKTLVGRLVHACARDLSPLVYFD